MPINRRTFISKSALMGGSFLLKKPDFAFHEKPDFVIPPDFSLRIMATNWGFQGTWDEFCSKAKETGYDGIEVWVPQKQEEQDKLMQALNKHQLAFGFLVGGGDSIFDKHLAQFQQAVEKAAALKPLFINCHSGRDYFTFEQNKQFIDFTTRISRSTGIRISHETHRSRILFAAHIAKNFIEKIPALRLTLDISHWCNVHESLLQDQQESVQLALNRTDHVHARVGHAESPQVTDPRAPEWKNELDTHFAWWDQIVKNKIDEGQSLTVTTEFGPPNYMPAVPFTRQPLADLWGINVHMMQLWRERYSE